MAKIRELISFEKIKEVIDIDAITDKKSMVEKYIISPALEEYLVHLVKDINNSEHKAAQIIGGYGSGKSHLLAFIISILTEKKLRNFIQNEKLKEEAEKINRDFCVVHWELQPNDVSLSEYFYDNVETQLADKYGIKIDVKTSGVVDHKKNIQTILDKIKQGKPTRGLVVIIDEISDFLKQKIKEKINSDVQFLRVLGQVAQACDFMFIGAMQEHIFSNPKYVDEAESFGRVGERFQIITIKREDIKRVISKRVLNKTPEQRIELETLFKEYVKYFPSISAVVANQGGRILLKGSLTVNEEQARIMLQLFAQEIVNAPQISLNHLPPALFHYFRMPNLKALAQKYNGQYWDYQHRVKDDLLIMH